MELDVRVDCKKHDGFPLGNQRLCGPYQMCGHSSLKACLRELPLIGFDLIKMVRDASSFWLYFFWVLIVHLN